MFLFFLSAVIHFVSSSINGTTPFFLLNDGKCIPGFGLGTLLGYTKEYAIKYPEGTEVAQAVEWAIDAGYRHIDTAYLYGNEVQVGQAVNKKIAEGVVKREDIFITTKLWSTFHATDAVVPALKGSLKNLHLDYVDLFLIHFPMAVLPNLTEIYVDYLDTWHGMIEAQKLGLTKSIGVSNFNNEMIDRLIFSTSVKPSVLQVEINLNNQQPELLAYCRKHNIVVTAYTPFGSLFYNKASPDAPPPRVDSKELEDIARKHNKTVPQIVLRYLVYLKVIPIPKSLTKSRIEENIKIFDFRLTKAERRQLRSYDRNYRTLPIREYINSPFYPFEKKKN